MTKMEETAAGQVIPQKYGVFGINRLEIVRGYHFRPHNHNINVTCSAILP